MSLAICSKRVCMLRKLQIDKIMNADKISTVLKACENIATFKGKGRRAPERNGSEQDSTIDIPPCAGVQGKSDFFDRGCDVILRDVQRHGGNRREIYFRREVRSFPRPDLCSGIHRLFGLRGVLVRGVKQREEKRP